MPPSATQDVPEQAGWLRRIAALAIDWFACMFIVIAFVGPRDYFAYGNGAGSAYTMALFVLETTVFTTLAGGSFGKLVTRLRTVRIDGTRSVDPVRSFVRSLLVILVLPPLVFRPGGRGLHDMAVGTATVPLAVLQR